ncbi:hypothetical protein DFP72DRAFT_488760 [Ephemerocybe angulata]|uniref:TERF2-interacting telomeric protein 1 Myb domain-containing protein n=1 Tax=Ephemerocybe angulata TaxID=980116 RepID=A0A8H6IGK3_9AGAR|nr:hypothetical protein DFP72DRAFT_488760 [Tulosesus angulatus]
MPPAVIFVHEDTGQPLKIYLDQTILPAEKKKWSAKVVRHGGVVAKDDSDVDIVVISKKADRVTRRLAYGASESANKRKVKVQTLTFLEDSVNTGRCVFTEPAVKGMSGQVGGKKGSRTNYTTADDDHLARYIAASLPELDAGGRQGHKIYQKLVTMVDVDEEYAWTRRHSWQSWQNRYKKNMKRFNKAIDNLIPVINPEKELRWEADRRQNRGNQLEEEEEEEDERRMGIWEAESPSRIVTLKKTMMTPSRDLPPTKERDAPLLLTTSTSLQIKRKERGKEERKRKTLLPHPQKAGKVATIGRIPTSKTSNNLAMQTTLTEVLQRALPAKSDTRGLPNPAQRQPILRYWKAWRSDPVPPHVGGARLKRRPTSAHAYPPKA